MLTHYDCFTVYVLEGLWKNRQMTTQSSAHIDACHALCRMRQLLTVAWDLVGFSLGVIFTADLCSVFFSRKLKSIKNAKIK